MLLTCCCLDSSKLISIFPTKLNLNLFENYYVPANSPHRNTHYFLPIHLLLFCENNELDLKCLAVSDKILFWAIQTFSPDSLNDQGNTLASTSRAELFFFC